MKIQTKFKILILILLAIFFSLIMFAQAPSNDCAESPLIINSCGTNFSVTQAQMSLATTDENCLAGGSCPINYTNGVGYDNLDCNTSTSISGSLGSDFSGSIENSLFWQFVTTESCTYQICVNATNCCCRDKGSTNAAQLHIYRISETLPVGDILEYYVTNSSFTGQVCYNINVIAGNPVLILIDGVNGTDCDVAVSVNQGAGCTVCTVMNDENIKLKYKNNILQWNSYIENVSGIFTIEYSEDLESWEIIKVINNYGAKSYYSVIENREGYYRINYNDIHKSNVVYVKKRDRVLDVKYFNIMGQEIDIETYKGIFFIITTYDNERRTVEKKIKI